MDNLETSSLDPIVKSMIFIGEQDWLLRIPMSYAEYCDMKEDGIEVEDDLENLFQGLLDLRMTCGDEKLTDVLNSTEMRKKYTSKDIQSKIIKVCKEKITGKLMEKIKETNVFSITFDRIEDIGEDEFVAVAIRYLDQDDDLHEDFLTYIPYHYSLKEDAVKQIVLDTLAKLGLDMAKCRGQCYFNKKKLERYKMTFMINNEYPSALVFFSPGDFFISSIISTTKVRKAFYPLYYFERVITLFVEMPEQKKLLVKHITKNNDLETAKKLIEISKTNWLERVDSAEVLENLLPSIDSCLHEFPSDRFYRNDNLVYHREYKITVSFEFIVVLVICRSILDFVAPFAKLIYSCEEDLFTGFKMISDLKKQLEQVDIDIHHDVWYRKGLALATALNMEEQKPREFSNKRKLDNDDNEMTIKDIYKKEITVPFLCDVIDKLDKRFPENSSICIEALVILPKIMLVSENYESWKESVLKFMTIYANDMACLETVELELAEWYQYWSEKSKVTDLPSTLISTLKSMSTIKDNFQNIYCTLKVLAVIPITRCESYKSFHKHPLLKCYVPDLVTLDRLNCAELFHMSVERDMKVSVDEVLEEFKKDPGQYLCC